MVLIELKKAEFAYVDVAVVGPLDLAIETGQIISIMGPSGCGKSTVLRLISGLEKPTGGRCFFNGANLEQSSPQLRFSFQDYDAFPWRTVRQNLLLGGATGGWRH